MKKSDMEKLEERELLELALSLGISVRKGARKPEIIKIIQSAKKPETAPIPPLESHAQDKPSAPAEASRLVADQHVEAGRQVQSWQQEVEESKFYTGAPPVEFRLPSELPHQYGDDRIALLVRDPYWAYSYWEVSQKKLEAERGQLGRAGDDAYLALRVYDVTDVHFDGVNDHGHYDIGIYDRIGNWYINTGIPGRSFIVDLGLKTQDGQFITLVRSNAVRTPRDSVSEVMDEEWMVPDSDFERIFALSGGFSTLTGASSADVRLAAGGKIPFGVSSPGMGSLALMSPTRKKQRAFWFVLNTELIVYGATEPDAKVSVQGRPVTLRPDGTFTLRFALPDGKQIIECSATSADEAETRCIAPEVTRSTKAS
ncbi:MAG: DUF4912 domain-containing protein [Nitrospirota bacterium]